MRKTLDELSFPLILALALFTPLVITCIWIGFIVTDHSIFPTDIYGAYKGWYEPGNAIKINNHYSLDLNFIGFPWKYYLASRPPEEIACTTSFPFFTFGHLNFSISASFNLRSDLVRRFLSLWHWKKSPKFPAKLLG
jgi:hypothetical protein